MARQTLYAYVDGSDLEGVATDIESRIERFVDTTAWRYAKPRVVNQRRPHASLSPGDLPDWDLGLNIDLPDSPIEPRGWSADIERIVTFLAQLRGLSGRDFVIGIGDRERGISEDLFAIDSASPDLETLRRIIGVRDGAS